MWSRIWSSPDAAIDRGIEYGRIDVPLLGELSDRLFAIVGQRDVDEAAELELGEARAGCRANDIELSPHAGGRDVLRRGRPHSGARRDHRDDVSLTAGKLEDLWTARRDEKRRPRLLDGPGPAPR